MQPSEQTLLDIVLQVSGDDEKRIRDGIKKAIAGIKDRARRTYLWHLLERAAKARIRAAKRRH